MSNENKIEDDRLILYIAHANEIVKHYESVRKHLLELHIGLMGFFSLAIPFLYGFFNPIGQFSLNIGIVILLFSTLVNLCVELIVFRRKTKGIEETNWHYRGKLEKVKIKELSSKEEKAVKEPNSKNEKVKYNLNLENINKSSDYRKHLKNLYVFQQRYNRCAYTTETIVTIGLIAITICLIISFFNLSI